MTRYMTHDEAARSREQFIMQELLRELARMREDLAEAHRATNKLREELALLRRE